MKLSFINRLPWRRNRPVESLTSAAKQVNASLWRDTGLLFYLMDTIKLTVETELGLMSLEKLSLLDLEQIIVDIQTKADGAVLPKQLMGQEALISISICAASWQERAGEKRIKAINEAAVLRLKQQGNCHSQALFKCENADLTSTMELDTVCSFSPNTHQYYDITLSQFIERLVCNNKRLPTELVSVIPVNSKNFASLFSRNETSIFNHFAADMSTG